MRWAEQSEKDLIPAASRSAAAARQEAVHCCWATTQHMYWLPNHTTCTSPGKQGTGEGNLADPASAADLSVNFNTDGEVKASMLLEALAVMRGTLCGWAMLDLHQRGTSLHACPQTLTFLSLVPHLFPRQLKLLDTAVTPACPAAKTSALIDSIAACDDYCSRGAWSFASLDWSVAAGSDIFGWQTAMPLLSSKPQPQAWPTCPNHLFSQPPPCPNNGTNGTAGAPGVSGAGPGGEPHIPSMATATHKLFQQLHPLPKLACWLCLAACACLPGRGSPEPHTFHAGLHRAGGSGGSGGAAGTGSNGGRGSVGGHCWVCRLA